MAYQGHIVVPTTHEKAEQVIDELTAKMAVRFGGYSRYDGTGGWEGENGRIEENHARLVVNSGEEYDRETFKGYLQIEATYVKKMLDEEAVLIEIHDIDMELM
jgi:hypothetical protein